MATMTTAAQLPTLEELHEEQQERREKQERLNNTIRAEQEKLKAEIIAAGTEVVSTLDWVDMAQNLVETFRRSNWDRSCYEIRLSMPSRYDNLCYGEYCHTVTDRRTGFHIPLRLDDELEIQRAIQNKAANLIPDEVTQLMEVTVSFGVTEDEEEEGVGFFEIETLLVLKVSESS